jgi:hypothetical protein
MARPRKSLKDSLAPIALVLSVAGVLLGSLESFTKVLDAFESHFYAFVTVCTVVAMVVIWKWNPTGRPGGRTLVRVLASGVLAAVFLGTVTYYYFDRNVRRTAPVRPSPSAAAPRPVPSSVVIPKRKEGTSTLKLEQLSLNSNLSSFEESYAPYYSASGGETIRTFGFDPTVYQALQAGQCAGPSGDQPMTDVLPVLWGRLERLDRRDLRSRIDTPEQLSRIVRERGDLFAQITFSAGDLKAMMSQSPADYQRAHEWLLYCIGLQNPVLTLVLYNAGEQSLLLTHVVYHVLEVGEVKGGASGVLLPDYTYDHALAHEMGDQPWTLTPPQEVGANQRVSFNLRLFARDPGLGLTWVLRIEVLATDGNFAQSEPIQIIMSK